MFTSIMALRDFCSLDGTGLTYQSKHASWSGPLELNLSSQVVSRLSLNDYYIQLCVCLLECVR